jgi:hypothetical protein
MIAGEKLVEHQPTGKDIRGKAGHSTPRHVLGRAVVIGADVSLMTMPGRTAVSQEREVHVDQLELIAGADRRILDQIRIRRLQIGMDNLGLMQRRHSGHEDLGPGDVTGPNCRVVGGWHLGAAMLLPLLVEHVLQVGAVLDELEGLEVASSAPDLFERIHLAHCELSRPPVADAGSELVLVDDERLVPDDCRSGRLVLLQKNLLSCRSLGPVGDRHHARPEDLRDTVLPDPITDLQLLGHGLRSL